MNEFAVHTSFIHGWDNDDTEAIEIHEFFDTLEQAMEFVKAWKTSSLWQGVTSYGITLYRAQWFDVESWEKHAPVQWEEVKSGKEKPELPGQAWCNPHGCHPSMCWDKHNPKYLP